MSTALKILEDIRPERREPKSIEPVNEFVRARYMAIYEAYCTKHLTHKQLAEQFNYSPGHIKNILKWAANEVGSVGDVETARESMVEKVSRHLQRLEDWVEGDKANLDTKDVVALLAEIRRSMKMLGEVQGVTMGDKAGGPAHIEINLPDLGRGEGTRGPQRPVIEVSPDEQS